MAEQRTDTELTGFISRTGYQGKSIYGDRKKIPGKAVLAYPPHAGGS